jgi:hypothetical protein
MMKRERERDRDDRRILLGVVERITRKSAEQPVAWLRPLYEASQDGGKWARAIDDPSVDFPNRGLVAWWKVPDAVQTKTFWQFSIEPSPTFSRDIAAHARYRATDVTELMGIIDGRSFSANDDEIRERLTETGALLAAPQPSRVYIRLHGNKWIGPLKLIERGRVWVIDPALTEEPLRVFEMTDPDAVVRIDFQGPRLFPGPESRPARVLGLVDWAADDVVVRRVLRRLRDFDTDYANQLKLTAATADRIAERLGVGSAVLEAQLDAQRLARMKRLLPRLIERVDLVHEVVAALMVSDAVKPELERHHAELLDQYRREAATAISRDTDSARRELEDLRAQRESLKNEVSEVRRELDALQARLEARVASFESALRDRRSRRTGSSSEPPDRQPHVVNGPTGEHGVQAGGTSSRNAPTSGSE